MAGVERRLAAILAADAVDYSRLMGANETTTHTRLRQLQAGTVDPRWQPSTMVASSSSRVTVP